MSAELALSRRQVLCRVAAGASGMAASLACQQSLAAVAALSPLSAVSAVAVVQPAADSGPRGAWPSNTGSGVGQATGSSTGRNVGPADTPALDREQSRRLRDWLLVLIHAQLEQGPTPRWTHRDCAGLVRFAVAEALREHDQGWKRSMGLLGKRLPPDLDPAAAQPLRHAWRRVDGTRAAFVGALELVQENTRFVGRQLAQAEPGDLLFYDFGDDQHLMVWMGPYIAYHTGRREPGDTGLRALRASQLMSWQDTRWRPATDNPNFGGLYRLSFLAR